MAAEDSMKEKIFFKARPSKRGPISYGFNIPRAFIKNGMVNTSSLYSIEIEELDALPKNTGEIENGF